MTMSNPLHRPPMARYMNFEGSRDLLPRMATSLTMGSCIKTLFRSGKPKPISQGSEESHGDRCRERRVVRRGPNGSGDSQHRREQGLSVALSVPSVDYEYMVAHMDNQP